MTRPAVVGLGFATLDTIGLTPHLPALDQGVLLEAVTRQGGGPVAQALVTLRRLGATTGFVGRLGDDDVGAVIRADLDAEGVDLHHLQIEPGATSPQSIILVDRPTGKRSICAFRGSVGDVVLDDEALRYAGSGRFLHLDGHSPLAAASAAHAARERGVRVCLDAGAGAPVEQLLALVPATDVLIAAEQFAARIAPDGAFATGAARVLGMGPDIVVVTRGDRGSYTFTADTAFATPAFPVAVVDTTGAGDVFHGAYLYGLLQGWTLESTAAFASATAAIKCTGLGGRAAIPPLPTVLRFLEERGITLNG